MRGQYGRPGAAAGREQGGRTSPGTAATIESLAHGVFTSGFVDAMKPTLVLPIAVLVLAAVASLWTRSRSSPGEATEIEASAPEASTLPQLVREGELV